MNETNKKLSFSDYWVFLAIAAPICHWAGFDAGCEWASTIALVWAGLVGAFGSWDYIIVPAAIFSFWMGDTVAFTYAGWCLIVMFGRWLLFGSRRPRYAWLLRKV